MTARNIDDLRKGVLDKMDAANRRVQMLVILAALVEALIIAAALFIYFLGRNGILYRPDGSKRLADNALVALTLLIAESRPEEKETIVKVIVSLINQKN